MMVRFGGALREISSLSLVEAYTALREAHTAIELARRHVTRIESRLEDDCPVYGSRVFVRKELAEIDNVTDRVYVPRDEEEEARRVPAVEVQIRAPKPVQDLLESLAGPDRS